MNTPLRRLSIVVVVMMLLLLGNATYIQVFRANELRADPHNARVLIDEYSRQRGQILAGTAVLAESRGTDDRYKYLRVYPASRAEEYAQLVGYYSMVYASGGLERSEDPLLNGSDPRLFGRRFADLLSGRDPRGGNVITTINPAMQHVAYQSLMTACNGPCRGSVVAVEPQTGKILAMVSTPSYDPNPLTSHDTAVQQRAWSAYTKDPANPMVNRAIDYTYPPGSTFKVITTAAALAQAAAGGESITPDTRLTASSVFRLPISGTTLTNYAGQTCPESSGGTVSLLNAFKYSCNTAFVQLATEKLTGGGQALTQMATNFGVNAPFPDIPLPVAESVTGDISNDDYLGQSAIGQRDVALTPLQNAVIAATIANGGVRMQPYLVDSLQVGLSPLATTTPQRLGQSVTPSVASVLQQLMLASEQHTTGSGGGGVEIASKTGTAEHSTGRSEEPPHAWYIAFGPVNIPKVAVSVIIENGGDEGTAATGGSIAAPIGRAVINAGATGQGG